GDRAEGHFQLGNVAIPEGGAEEIEQPLAADQAASPSEVHQPHHLSPREPRDPVLELVELPGSVDRADQRADRGAADEIGLDAALFERADRADVRPAPGAARAEREADFWFSRHGPYATGNRGQTLPRAQPVRAHRSMPFQLHGAMLLELVGGLDAFVRAV